MTRKKFNEEIRKKSQEIILEGFTEKSLVLTQWYKANVALLILRVPSASLSLQLADLSCPQEYLNS